VWKRFPSLSLSSPFESGSGYQRGRSCEAQRNHRKGKGRGKEQVGWEPVEVWQRMKRTNE